MSLTDYNTILEYVELKTIANIISNPNHISYSNHSFLLQNDKNSNFNPLNILLYYPSNKYQMLPLNINDHQNIKLVSHGINANHTIILDANLKLYGIGNGKYSAFGDSNETEHEHKIAQHLSQITARLINIAQINIIDIACGDQYSMFVASNGNVYGVGSNHSGQLGISKKHYLKVSTVKKIPLLYNICQIQCGFAHTLCLSTNKKLWVCGSNDFGQLGIGKEYAMIDRAIIHPYFENKCVIKISAGSMHSLCVTHMSDVCKCFTFGYNLFAQVNHKLYCAHVDKIYEPFLCRYEFECKAEFIIDGECGYWFTVLVSNCNQILLSSKEGIKIHLLPNKCIERIVCGKKNILVIST